MFPPKETLFGWVGKLDKNKLNTKLNIYWGERTMFLVVHLLIIIGYFKLLRSHMNIWKCACCFFSQVHGHLGLVLIGKGWETSENQTRSKLNLAWGVSTMVGVQFDGLEN